jgi:hypothetical protein
VAGRLTEDTNMLLKNHRHGPTVPRESNLVLKQIGWLGQTGQVYAYDDQPMDSREPGSFTPLYFAVGVWEDLGDGQYGIKD